MANSKSAKKRIRTNERRRVINKTRLSRLRTFIKKVDEAIKAGVKADAQEAFKNLQPELHRGQVKGLMHKNKVARVLSRLSAKIKAIA